MAPHLLYKPKWLPKWCIFPSLRYEFTVFFKYIQLDGHQQHVSSSSPANRMHTLMNKRMKEDERFLKTELDLVYCNWVLQLTAWLTGLIRPLKTYSNQLNKSCKGQRKGLRRLVHNTFEMKYTNIQIFFSYRVCVHNAIQKCAPHTPQFLWVRAEESKHLGIVIYSFASSNNWGYC